MADIEHIELNGDTYDIADAPARESVEAENKAREEADSDLQAGVEAETKAREEADTTLQTNVETESKAREEADTTLQNLITKLDFLNQSGMVLTEGQDLDDLTDYGIKYTSSGSSISSTLINSPYSNVAFFLYVCRPYANQTQRLQIAVSASSTSTIYYRYYSGSAWGSWTKLARQQDIDNLEDDLETNAWLLYGGVRISENADLNEYTEIGNYFCNSNSRAQTLVNSPTTSAFTMKVYSGLGNNTSYLVQQINTYTLSVYERYYYNESWRAWHQVPLLDDVDSAVEAEAKAREEADTSLQTSIDTESKTRENADTNLTDAVDAITSSSAYTWAEDTSTKSILVWQRQLTASDDLDNVLEAGMYYAATGDIPANSPYSNAFVLIVFALNSRTTRIVQLCFRYGSAGHMSFRPLTGSSWLSWKSVALSDDVNAITSSSAYTWAEDYSTKQIVAGEETSLSANDDLDNIFDSGIYGVSSGTTPKNWPWDSNSGTANVVVYRRSSTGAAVQWVMSGMTSSTNYNYRTAFRALSPSYGAGSWRYVISSTTPVQRVQMQRGSVSVSASANAYTDVAVTFDTAFTGSITPCIFLTINSSTTNLNYGGTCMLARSVSQTGFTIRFINNSSSNLSPTIAWFAVYVS